MTNHARADSAKDIGIPPQSLAAIFRRFLGFGMVAWGGPVAQIGMLRRELVDHEHWISSERFNRTLAVYQALPGPEAHELCVYFGYLARGRIGGLVAGLGFMLPGFALMLALAWFYVVIGIGSPIFAALFAGAQAAVLALIVRAVVRIGSHALTGPALAGLGAVSLAATLVGVPFLAIIGLGGAIYLMVAQRRRSIAIALAGAYVGLVVLLGTGAIDGETASPESPRAAPVTAPSDATPAELLVSGLRAGLLTFGGAYTAIPFLQQDAVTQGGWMSDRAFLDGVALSGILPAPLIIFATFVGFVAGGLVGAVVITVAVFAPAFGFTLLGHRQLERIVQNRSAHAVLDGITAAVVGLIAGTALLLVPTAIRGVAGAAIFVVALVALSVWKSGAAIAAVMVAAGVLGLLLFGVAGLAA